MILVEREELPPAEGREHYRDDLVGFEAKNLEGAVLGSVDHFVDTPGNAVMVIKGAREHWVPVTGSTCAASTRMRAGVGGLARGLLTRLMHIEVVTLFPELIQQALKLACWAGRGARHRAVGCEDPRAHTRDVHRTVDDRPYGGGPGMVLKPEPMSRPSMPRRQGCQVGRAYICRRRASPSRRRWRRNFRSCQA
jgi:hypothetical protein